MYALYMLRNAASGPVMSRGHAHAVTCRGLCGCTKFIQRRHKPGACSELETPDIAASCASVTHTPAAHPPHTRAQVPGGVPPGGAGAGDCGGRQAWQCVQLPQPGARPQPAAGDGVQDGGCVARPAGETLPTGGVPAAAAAAAAAQQLDPPPAAAAAASGGSQHQQQSQAGPSRSSSSTCVES